MGGGIPREAYLESERQKDIKEGVQKTLIDYCDICEHSHFHHGKGRCVVKHCKGENSEGEKLKGRKI